jgi:uncharacterized protein YdaU (DUF1376 family)
MSYPYFPLYPKDLLADHKVMVMDNEALGAYLRLLCVAWHENPPATLPQDDLILARYAGTDPSRWQVLKPVVLAPFDTDARRYVQKRLKREFERLSSRSKKAREAVSTRWSKYERNTNVSKTYGERITRAYGSGSGSGSGSGPENPEVPGKGVSPEVSAQRNRVAAPMIAAADRVLDVMAEVQGVSGDGIPRPMEQREPVMLALNDGFTEAQLVAVARHRWRKWREDGTMRQHYTAETIFKLSRLADYVRQAIAAGLLAQTHPKPAPSAASVVVTMTDAERAESLAALRGAIRK